MKAFGYGNRAIAAHYLGLVLVIVIAGALLGTLVGLRFGQGLMSTYEEYFRFPQMRYELTPGLVAWSLGISLLAAVTGALGAVRRAVHLPPAEAMRPEPPARFRAGFLERTGLLAVTSPPARILLRNLARRPGRLAMSVLSIALAVTVLVVGRYFEDAIGLLMEIHFRNVERQQATVQFSVPIDARVSHDLRHLPGVLRVEPFRAVPVRIRYGPRVERTLVFGLTADAELRRIIGKSRRVATPPAQGVVLTDFLARTLGARTGDVVTLEVLEGRRAVRETPIVGEIDELIGTYAYMDLGALARLVGEESLSGAYLSVDPLKELAFDRALKGVPAVSGVSMREAAIRNYEESISEVFGTFTATLILLATVVAVGVVYNGARIALFERGRELASLRVLGFTRQEVLAMLFGEQAIIMALGIPCGFLLGYGLSALVSLGYQNKLIRLPLFITTASYAFAFLVIVAAAVVSGLIVKRRADRLDLVAVLKTRE